MYNINKSLNNKLVSHYKIRLLQIMTLEFTNERYNVYLKLQAQVKLHSNRIFIVNYLTILKATSLIKQGCNIHYRKIVSFQQLWFLFYQSLNDYYWAYLFCENNTFVWLKLNWHLFIYCKINCFCTNWVVFLLK